MHLYFGSYRIVHAMGRRIVEIKLQAMMNMIGKAQSGVK